MKVLKVLDKAIKILDSNRKKKYIKEKKKRGKQNVDRYGSYFWYPSGICNWWFDC